MTGGDKDNIVSGFFAPPMHFLSKPEFIDFSPAEGKLDPLLTNLRFNGHDREKIEFLAFGLKKRGLRNFGISITSSEAGSSRNPCHQAPLAKREIEESWSTYYLEGSEKLKESW